MTRQTDAYLTGLIAGAILTALAVFALGQDEGFWVPVRVPVQTLQPMRPCKDDCECVRWGLILERWSNISRNVESGHANLRDVSEWMP